MSGPEIIVGLVIFFIVGGLTESFWIGVIVASIVISSIDIDVKFEEFKTQHPDVFQTDQFVPSPSIDPDVSITKTQEKREQHIENIKKGLIAEYIGDQIRTEETATIEDDVRACRTGPLKDVCFDYRLRKQSTTDQIYVCEMDGINCFTLKK